MDKGDWVFKYRPVEGDADRSFFHDDDDDERGDDQTHSEVMQSFSQISVARPLSRTSKTIPVSMGHVSQPIRRVMWRRSSFRRRKSRSQTRHAPPW